MLNKEALKLKERLNLRKKIRDWYHKNAKIEDLGPMRTINNKLNL
jgi:hypothetical protein